MERYDEYKDSGVEWIGEVPAGWAIRRFKSVLNIIGGNGFPVEYQGDCCGDYPFCKVSDINGAGKEIVGAANYISSATATYLNVNVIPIGSILMAKIGAAMLKNHRKKNLVECCIDNNMQALTPLPNTIQTDYLYWLSSIIDMSWFGNAGTIPCINNEHFLDSFCAIPSIDEQQQISSFLDERVAETDSLIADCEREVELLQEYRKAVISEAVTKGLDPNVPMKDSGIEWIGAIPVSWETARLDKIAVRKSGHTPDKKVPEYWDGDIVWVSLADSPALRTNKYISTSTTMTTREGIAHSSAEVLPAGSVLLSRDASVGLTAIAGVPLAVSQHFMAYICGDNLSNEYLRYVFLAMRQEFERLSMGSTIPTIGLPLVKQFVIPYPLRKVQDAIVAYLDEKTAEIDALIADYQSMADKLREYRKSLISEAVTGKFKVPGV